MSSSHSQRRGDLMAAGRRVPMRVAGRRRDRGSALEVRQFNHSNTPARFRMKSIIPMLGHKKRLANDEVRQPKFSIRRPDYIIFRSVSAISLGVTATPMPASLNAAIFASAVPLPPLTMAPA